MADEGCGLFCVIDYILAVFVAFTLPFYVLVLVVAIRYHGRLKSSFFTLFISAGIADVWLTLHNYAFAKIPRIFFREEVLNNKWMATMSKMGIWYIYYAQVLGVVLLTLNRFSALVTPTKFKKIWKKKQIMIAIFLQWFLPVSSLIPQFFPCCYSHFTETLYPVFDDNDFHKLMFTFCLLFEAGIFAPTFIVLYTAMFYKAYKQTRSSKTSQQEKKEIRLESRLAATGVILCALYVIMVSTYVFFYIQYVPRAISLTFYYSSDLFTTTNPYLLLAFSTKFRIHFIAFVTRKDPNEVEAAAIVAPKKSCTVAPPRKA